MEIGREESGERGEEVKRVMTLAASWGLSLGWMVLEGEAVVHTSMALCIRCMPAFRAGASPPDQLQAAGAVAILSGAVGMGPAADPEAKD